MSAGQLIEQLGLEQANASQHLVGIARQTDRHQPQRRQSGVLLAARPVLVEVLDILKRYFYSHLSQTMSMLEEMQTAEEPLKK